MKKINYSWVICFAGLLAIMINMGCASNMLGVSMPYLKAEFSLTDSQTSSIVTMRCLSTVVSMLIINKIYEKISLRVGIALSVLIASLGFFIIGISNNYLGFAISGLLFGISYGVGGMVPISMLINNWFTKGRGTAIGISSCGSGLAIVILSPIATRCFESIGIKISYMWFSGIIAVMAVVMFLIVRSTPEGNTLSDKGKREAGEKKSFKEILPVNIWATLIILSLLWGSIGSPGYTHMPTMYKSIGIDSITVARLTSICSLMLMLGKVICGRISDRIGYRKTLYFFTLACLIGNILIILSSISGRTTAYASAILSGIGYSAATLSLIFWATNISKKEDYSRVIKVFQIAYALGSLAFANIPGILADHFNGSYIPSYIMFVVQGAIILVLMPIVYMLMDKKGKSA